MATVDAAIVLGGLGYDQTESDLQSALEAAGIRVFSPGKGGVPGESGGDYKVDAVSLVKRAMNEIAVGVDAIKLVAIGHSFGAHTVCQTIGRLYREDHLQFDYVCLIDPVSYSPVWARSITIDAPQPAKGLFEVFYRKRGLLPPNARIVDSAGSTLADPKAADARIIDGDHNTICHNAAWIAELVQRIGALRGNEA